MTVDPVSMDELLGTRETMVDILRQHLDDSARRFLMTFHELQPDWDALGLPTVQDLPAIRWKSGISNACAMSSRIVIARCFLT